MNPVLKTLVKMPRTIVRACNTGNGEMGDGDRLNLNLAYEVFQAKERSCLKRWEVLKKQHMKLERERGHGRKRT